MEQLLRVGVITTTHGIRGEVKVFPTTDDIHRFDDLEEVILQNKKEQLTLHIEHVKYFKNIVIVKFKEYNNINDVEMFRKCDLLVTREHAVPLEEGEYFICDVIGAKVITWQFTRKAGNFRLRQKRGKNCFSHPFLNA